MKRDTLTTAKPSAQIKLFEIESTQLLRLASVVQEPLDLLLAKNKHKLSVIDRRVYWYILAKMGELQTANRDEPLPIPAENLVFSIPVRDLYLTKPDAHYTAEDPADKPKSKQRGILTNKLTYSNFEAIAQQLIEKSIIIVDHMNIVDPTKRKVGAIAIFPRVFYENGHLEVHVDRLIVPAMCTLGKGYAKFKREAAMSLGRDYSQILYVRLCRFVDIHQWRVSVADLKEILEATSYERYSNFKQKVLTPCMEEINKRTDIYVECKEVRVGRAVDTLHFSIYLKQDKTNQQSQKQLRQEINTDLRESILSLNLPLRQANVQAILSKRYTFSGLQQKAILAEVTKLDKFIELDYKIINGLLKIKTNPTRYIASILFPISTRDSSIKLTFE
jgi:plasmid replication initiation protein